MNNLIYIFLLFVLACSSDQNEITNAVLITPEQNQLSIFTSIADLHWKLENNSNLKVIEIGTHDKYLTGHIPTALNIWRSDFNASKNENGLGGFMGTKEQLEATLSALGVTQEDTLVLYDNRGGCEATRLNWVLAHYGRYKQLILNGGKDEWIAHHFELETEQNLIQTSTYRFPENLNQSDIIASSEEVLRSLLDKETIILDTRSEAEFCGDPYLKKGKIVNFNPSGFQSGRIPNAVHYDWGNAVNFQNNKMLKSITDIQYDLQKLGIQKDKNIIVYCQSGTRSTHTFYVLKELLQFESVKNYDGSWIEWSYLVQQENFPFHLEEETLLFKN